MNIAKHIVITGANGQSACHIIKELMQYDTILLLLSYQRTDRLEKIINENPGKCTLLKCDLTDFHNLEKQLSAVFNETNIVPDALIHTAAIRSYDAKPLSESDPIIWNSIVQNNISMAYNILRYILPMMIKQQKGKVVVFGSNVTRTGLPYGTAYAAAKSALANLVRSTALETASDNIQINMISPAPIDTNLEEDYTGNYLQFRKEYFEAYKKTHPAHRLVAVSDITKMTLSLIDNDLNSLSGEEIFLTGGVL